MLDISELGLKVLCSPSVEQELEDPDIIRITYTSNNLINLTAFGNDSKI